MGLLKDRRDDGYEPVTLEAADLVFGDRNVSYGHPLDDFSCTAAMWTAFLEHRGLLMPDAKIDAEDVGPLMILVKLSRQANAPKRDNLVDAAGYAETTGRVIHERARRAEELENFSGAVQDVLAERRKRVYYDAGFLEYTKKAQAEACGDKL